MNAIEFCYWLQGYVELAGSDELTPEQWRLIKEHLQLVFEKVTGNLTCLGPVKEAYPTDDITYCSSIGEEIGYSQGGDEVGYQFLNTAFTGSSATKLC